MSHCLQLHVLSPTRFLYPWDFPGKNPGVGCHLLLQGIFLTQGGDRLDPAGYGGSDQARDPVLDQSFGSIPDQPEFPVDEPGYAGTALYR